MAVTGATCLGYHAALRWRAKLAADGPQHVGDGSAFCQRLAERQLADRLATLDAKIAGMRDGRALA